MRFKNLVASLSNEDILNLIYLQDKLLIKKLTIDKNIEVNGLYKLIGVNFEFYTKLSVIDFHDNTLYIKIEDFKLANKNNSSIIVKKSIGFITNSINEIDGIILDQNMLKIDLKELLDSYCSEDIGIKINKLKINNVLIKNNEIELALGLLEISILKNKK